MPNPLGGTAAEPRSGVSPMPQLPCPYLSGCHRSLELEDTKP